ncbi:hypothetical protein COY34_01900, partial [candidate division WWE3 bacterium CG_4_10_14_0_2_um_filter_42_8]
NAAIGYSASTAGPTKGLAISGKVGIGTTSPQVKLDVAGTIRASTFPVTGDTALYRDDATGDIALLTSDIRLKKNLTSLSSSQALTVVQGLTGYLYNALDEPDGAKKRLGFMAQDLIKLGLNEATYSFTGSDGTEYFSIHYEKLPVLLVEAIKEQQQQIEQLKLASANLTNFDLSALFSQTREIATILTREITDRQLLSSRVGELVGNLEAVINKLADLQNETSQSATLAQNFSLSPQGDLILDKNLVLNENLNVKGKTTLTELAVGKSITAGLVVIDGEKGSLQTTAGPLQLQSDSLGELEIMSGKVAIDKDGNLKISEGVIAGNSNFRNILILGAGVTEFKIQNSQGKSATECKMGEILEGKVVAECGIMWDTAPVVVNVTPSYKTTIWVEDITKDGFTIKVGDAPQKEEKVYWLAMW